MTRSTPISKTRIGGSRSRHGCTTCRARRVKCDEQKPVCLRCAKTGNTCGGYITASSSNPKKPLSMQFVNYGNSSQTFIGHSVIPLHEEECFHYFVTTVIVDFRRPFDSKLWTILLCEVAKHKQIVRSGLIALAAFHKSFLRDEQGESEGDYARFGSVYYGQMISEWGTLAQDSREQPLAALVTCLLLCAIESLRGHFASATRFIKQGVALLTGETSQARVGGSDDYTMELAAMLQFDELCPLFIDMSGQVMAMHGPCDGDYTYLSTQCGSPITGAAFRSPKVALAELSILMNDLYRFSSWANATKHDSDFPCTPLKRARANMNSRYQEWTSAYHSMLHNLVEYRSDRAAGAAVSAVKILRAYQLVCSLILETSFELGQICFDRHVDTFREVFDCAKSFLITEKEFLQPFHECTERPYFGLNCGIVPVLYFIAFRCRLRKLRHHVLALLQRTHRREGIWDAALAAQVLKVLISVEEGRARENKARKTGVLANTVRIEYPEDIPDRTRIESVNIIFTEGRSGTIHIRFATGETIAPVHISWDK